MNLKTKPDMKNITLSESKALCILITRAASTLCFMFINGKQSGFI